MRSYTVSEDTTLKTFTDNTDAQASFCLRTLLKGREVRVNGVKVGEDVPLHAGDTVCYDMTAAQENKPAFQEIYEDDNILVIDKESGVGSEAVFAGLLRRGTYYFIHRLDRNTEGLMLFAKNAAAEEELLTCFRERRIEKIYYALAVGKMERRHAVEEAYLVKDEKSALVRVSSKPIGEKIITEYEVMGERGGCSLLKITLHTGKTHQIRAHLAYLGHPLAGDEKYGDTAFNRSHHITRQRLLAKELILNCGGPLSYLNGKHFLSEKSL